MIGSLSFKYLISICILAGIIMLELTYEASAIEPLAMVRLDHSVVLRRNLTQTSDKPAAVLAAAILARPLFSPGRHPAPPVKRSNMRKAMPRLSGVIIYGTKRLAIFAAPQGGKPIVAAEGDRVGDWLISLVQPDWVTLVGRTGSLRIQPIFASPSTMKPTPAPAPKSNPVTAAMAASRHALRKLLERGR
jgi:hypothetical protein